MDIVDRMKHGEKITIGMVHLLPLPGTLKYGGDFQPIVDQAVEDARKLQKAGFDALIVENVNDAPFDGTELSVWQVSALAIICDNVRRAVDLPIGIDACGDSLAGFMIGDLTGIDFIRIPYFVDIRIGQYGIINPVGSDAVVLRKRNGMEKIRILADVQVKHTYPLNSEIPIEASARWAESVGADALIVTGLATGMETPIDVISRVKAVSGLPVVVGSGMNSKNAKQQFEICDGAIIGSALKLGGNLMNPIDFDLAEAFIRSVGKEDVQ
ncbi:MAG: BtpA/SgcQ family protein [Firmicutes bacterium]|nr:BtpA/SgcQ family protein [Bacillota bacterium]